jgi:LacI family gluconate utilization system Gnt-I transcriptional repressor
MRPALTTVRTPRAEISQTAAAMLIALIHGEPVTTPCVDLGYRLLLHQSP